MISRAGATASTADTADSTGSSGADVAVSRNATSGSTRGWISAARSTVPPSGTPSRRSAARDHLVHADLQHLGLAGEAQLEPDRTARRAPARRAGTAACTAYAVGRSSAEDAVELRARGGRRRRAPSSERASRPRSRRRSSWSSLADQVQRDVDDHVFLAADHAGGGRAPPGCRGRRARSGWRPARRAAGSSSRPRRSPA